MIPISILLVHMGSRGLEMVKAYPDVLPQGIINQIVLKSMPLGAKKRGF